MHFLPVFFHFVCLAAFSRTEDRMNPIHYTLLSKRHQHRYLHAGADLQENMNK